MAYTAVSFAYKEVLTSAKMTLLAENDAFLKAQHDSARTAYTPAIAGPTVNYGTGAARLGRYRKVGREVIGEASIQFGTGATITGAQDWLVQLPVAAAGAAVLGSCFMQQTSGQVYVGTYQVTGATVNAVIRPHGSFFTTNNTRPFTWAPGDLLAVSFAYETAS